MNSNEYAEILVRVMNEREQFFPDNIGEMTYEERRIAVADATKTWWASQFLPGGAHHEMVGKTMTWWDNEGRAHTSMFDANGNLQDIIS